jgi:ribosomal peptide maturation radical SAM protein 1
VADVELIAMPFGAAMSPSIGLSLLKATLARDGIESSIHYFNIRFAELAGDEFYTKLAGARRPALRELAGEWIFSAALFDEAPTRDEEYVDEILRNRASWGERAWMQRPLPKRTIDRVLRARAKVPAFLDECVGELVGRQPRVIGFTSTFQQHVASLALAKRLKAALPGTFIVMGGANCEGAMGAETVRQFHFIDAVVSGEGEVIFPRLVRRIIQGQSVDDLPGVRTRANIDQGDLTNAPAVASMDDLPYPDYSDFFRQFGTSPLDREWQPGLFFESARGCWWGERMHCTFCGLNGGSMRYRSKSQERALTELLTLAERYAGCDVAVTDNILDLHYFQTFIPALAQRNLELGLMFETKANLRKEQVRALRAANIRSIQPGIESLSDEVLKLMRKGVTALQNIQLLKWCRELGIEPAWNVLWGFPREPSAEYARMARLIPLLTHLPPPGSFSGIRMDRFSPNHFDADKLGFTDVTPLPSYRHIYALPSKAIANLAYYFTFRYAEPQQPETYVKPFLRALRNWQRTHRTSALFFADDAEKLVICDLRPVAKKHVTTLRGIDRVLYRACDAMTDGRQLADACGLARAEVSQRLQPMVDAGLMILDGTRYLALAIPLGHYRPDNGLVARLREVTRSLGRASDIEVRRRSTPAVNRVPLNERHDVVIR